MGCRRYSAASRHEVLLDEDDLRSFSQALELGDGLLLSGLHVTVLVLWNQFRAPLFDPPTGFPVSAWSSSTCLWILIHIRVSPYLLSLWHHHVSLDKECRDQTRCDSRFPLWPLVHIRVSPYLTIGFWVSLGSVGYLCCSQRHQNPNHTSNYLCRNFSVVVEVTNIPSGIWVLQISSQSLSRYIKLGVYRRGWLRSILFDGSSILFVEQVVCRPSTPYLGAFSTFACTMQDVVWSNQALADPCDSFAWDSRLSRIPSVCPC